MKRIISFILILTIPFAFYSCKSGRETSGKTAQEIKNILFLGDDLMETSRVYDYFSQLCEKNGKDVTVTHVTQEDARMYTYSEKCKNDSDFAESIYSADLILFEEGTSETATTVDSVSNIVSYANDPAMICITYYGYPNWMYRNILSDPFPWIEYADANYFISKIIAADDAPIGYENLCLSDYIHPNELNGYLTAIVIYCEVYDTMPCYINCEGFETDEALIACANSDPGSMDVLISKLNTMITRYMK